MSNNSSVQQISKYYDEKTSRIVNKYGPGPIIHYHTGIHANVDKLNSLSDISFEMHQSQDEVLQMITDNFASTIGENSTLLDIGCGLGGGSLYIAKNIHANILGMTIASEHIPIIEGYSRELSLDHKVKILNADAMEFTHKDKFDGAIAIESPCYMSRKKFFMNISANLKTGAELHIFDWELVTSNEKTNAINSHWKTNMGTMDEYHACAEASNMELAYEKVMNEDTYGFWFLANKWNELSLMSDQLPQEERSRIEESCKAIDLLIEAYKEGSMVSVYQIFRKK